MTNDNKNIKITIIGGGLAGFAVKSLFMCASL
jgi:hypothetical protein